MPLQRQQQRPAQHLLSSGPLCAVHSSGAKWPCGMGIVGARFAAELGLPLVPPRLCQPSWRPPIHPSIHSFWVSACLPAGPCLVPSRRAAFVSVSWCRVRRVVVSCALRCAVRSGRRNEPGRAMQLPCHACLRYHVLQVRAAGSCYAAARQWTGLSNVPWLGGSRWWSLSSPQQGPSHFITASQRRTEPGAKKHARVELIQLNLTCELHHAALCLAPGPRDKHWEPRHALARRRHGQSSPLAAVVQHQPGKPRAPPPPSIHHPVHRDPCPQVHAHLAGPHRHPCPSWIIEVAAVHSPTTSSYHRLLVLLRSERPRVAGRRVWRLTGPSPGRCRLCLLAPFSLSSGALHSAVPCLARRRHSTSHHHLLGVRARRPLFSHTIHSSLLLLDPFPILPALGRSRLLRGVPSFWPFFPSCSFSWPGPSPRWLSSSRAPERRASISTRRAAAIAQATETRGSKPRQRLLSHRPALPSRRFTFTPNQQG